MNLKEQFKESWTFAVAAGIFILLVVLSTSDIYEVGNTVWGIAHILLAVTVTYTCLKAARRFQEKGKYADCTRLIYGAGFLSGLWLYEAIEYLF
ncbi:MAG: hypothetical protein LLF80_01535 [Porphyromonadaceae bacterium]|nr:hypothetical protein [Porphyromonadaceae bacterium]